MFKYIRVKNETFDIFYFDIRRLVTVLSSDPLYIKTTMSDVFNLN